jgi:stearoyl-CoA desaturase (delta-9 desaturase)
MNALIYVLLTTHLTIIAVTLYLHRSQTHLGVTFHPAVNNFFRFWLWLTTGMVTKEWVAIHRKHHGMTDQKGDPHSPQLFGIWKVLFGGAILYNTAAKDKLMVNAFGKGTPDDWMEKNVYSKHSRLGITLLLLIDLLCFSWWGLLIWGIQMLWIPLLAAGVINGVGHYWGYRNYETRESSRNIFPLGIIIGGEELHNNHHSDAGSAKLSKKWFELDIGWIYIKLLETLRLAKLNSKG